MDEGDINEIAKIHWRDDCPHLKIFSRTIGVNFNKTWLKTSLGAGELNFHKNSFLKKEMIDLLIINVYNPSFVQMYSLIRIVCKVSCKISICKKGAIGVGIHGESIIHNR